MDQNALKLFQQIKILKSNKHYRFTDLILCRGIRWAQDRQIIMTKDKYKGTILRKYLEKRKNIYLKSPPRLRELHETILRHAFENNLEMPKHNSLTLPLRLGDITEEKERFKRSILLSENLLRNIQTSKLPNPKTIYIVSALHYGANEINNKYFFSEESYEENLNLFLKIYKQISKLDAEIIIKSSRNIDKDICFIARSHFVYPSQSRMTELIQKAQNSFICNPTNEPIFATHIQPEKNKKILCQDSQDEPLKKFKDIHYGKRAILVCNGPSLNKIDFEAIKNERIIGLNKIHLGLKRFGLNPDYIVAINNLVIEQAIKEMAKINCPKFIMNHSKSLAIKDKNIYMINRISGPRAGQRGDGINFSTDLAKGFIGGNTVTYAALQIAFYMGFSKIIIIGMDHNFTYHGNPNQEGLLDGADPNHFDSSYFSNMLWHNPDLKASEEAYKYAKETYELNGRQIIDSTIDGKCKIFDKQDLKEALRSEHKCH